LSREPIAAFHARARAKILGGTNDAGLRAVVGNVQNPAGGSSFDEQWLSEAANDLLAKPGASLVLTGPNQPLALQLLVYAITLH